MLFALDLDLELGKSDFKLPGLLLSLGFDFELGEPNFKLPALFLRPPRD